MIHESWVKGMRFALASKGETPHDVPDVNLNREVIPPMEKIIEFRAACVQATTVSISVQHPWSGLMNSGKSIHDVIRCSPSVLSDEVSTAVNTSPR